MRSASVSSGSSCEPRSLGLSLLVGSRTVAEHTDFGWANRLAPFIAELRATGAFDVPHPCFDVFLPDDAADDYGRHRGDRAHCALSWLTSSGFSASDSASMQPVHSPPEQTSRPSTQFATSPC